MMQKYKTETTIDSRLKKDLPKPILLQNQEAQVDPRELKVNNQNNRTYVVGIFLNGFGILGMVVADLKTNVSLIGPVSLATESVGSGFFLDP